MSANVLKNLTMQIKSSQEILDNAKASVMHSLKEVVSDENIPLYDRWCLFMEYSPQCLPIESSVISREITDGVRKIYDLDRYRNYIFSEVFEEYWTTEDEKSNPPDPEKFDINVPKEAFENLPESLVRKIITCGCSGFEYDW